MPCSKELSDKINYSLIEPDFPTNDKYRVIGKNYLGDCPMLDESGLCMIHSQLGIDALPSVCKQYPRSLKKVNDVYEANCSNSCEAVVQLLMKKDIVHFKTIEKDQEPSIILDDNKDAVTSYLLFTNVIKDRSVLLNKRIQTICEHLSKSKYSIDDSLTSFLQVANFIKTVSVNSPIYEDFINMLSKRYSLDEKGLDKYKKDEKLFETNYPNWMIYFENVIVNHLYYMNLPYVDERLQKQDCYKGICLLYAIMKIICSVSTIDDHSNDNLAYVISDIFHLVEHTAFYYNAYILIKNEISLLYI